MSFLPQKSPPRTEAELMQRCWHLEGLSFLQLADELGLSFPQNPVQRKGWLGQAIECYLGASAANSSQPDFKEIGVELKTLPLLNSGKPAESTFVTTIPLLTIHEQTWDTSQCYQKLKRVLWIPVEGDQSIPYATRRIGRGTLWSPDTAACTQLAEDWQQLCDLIAMGKIHEVNSSIGSYLQIRPKASNSQSLCFAFDEKGNKIQTLPRGFYLRPSFTATVLS